MRCDRSKKSPVSARDCEFWKRAVTEIPCISLFHWEVGLFHCRDCASGNAAVTEHSLLTPSAERDLDNSAQTNLGRNPKIEG